MRLIDADLLMEKLNVFNDREHGNEYFLYGIETAKELLEDVPTAYDVEKVIEELERIRAKETCEKEKCDTKEICRICVIDDAIEIVKQCGTSDDVCE